VSFRVELPGAAVLFSTRQGGVSQGAFESLNLGLLTGDDRDAVIRNRRRLAEQAAVPPENVVMGWQVHGTDTREWDGPDPGHTFLDPTGGQLKLDGHITRTAGIAPLVLVADCLPVAIAGRGAVALLHCGWRGLAGGLIAKAAAQMCDPAAAGADASGLVAAVGPGIGRCCYEVGDEVLEPFADYEGVADGRMLDLRAVADAQLRAAGIERVEHVDRCTSCHPELFFSHRRDNGVTGRQGAIAWLTG
jgi:YfiH family protein